MVKPRGPIFLFEPDGSGDMDIYDSVEEAQNDLEPWYVEKEDFLLYDADGNRLIAELDCSDTSFWSKIFMSPRTIIRRAGNEPTRSELAAHIHVFAKNVGIEMNNSPSVWDDFIEEAVATIRNLE